MSQRPTAQRDELGSFPDGPYKGMTAAQVAELERQPPSYAAATGLRHKLLLMYLQSLLLLGIMVTGILIVVKLDKTISAVSNLPNELAVTTFNVDVDPSYGT